MTGVGPLVVPGFVVDRADAEELHPARVDVVGQRLDHPLSGVLVLISPAGREDEHGMAVVAIDVDAHVPSDA
jgi:hypothetical protein